jgi:hypothetical protein
MAEESLGVFLRGFCCCGLPVLLLMALWIWKPPYEPVVTRSIPDRIAWTVFALGVCLMFNMALYAMMLEDTSYRPWELIQFHVRMFFGIAMIPFAGPLIAFLWQSCRRSGDDSRDKKATAEDWIE